MPHAAKPAAIKEQKEWGIAGDAKAVTRTITLRMGDDMRFAPSHIQVREGDIVWQFNRAGQFDFACLIAGHYQAGMTGTITVLPRAH